MLSAKGEWRDCVFRLFVISLIYIDSYVAEEMVEEKGFLCNNIIT